MGKRDNKTMTLGSGKLYLVPFSNELPTVETICVDANLIGLIKGGATLTYTQETQAVADDLNLVNKIVTTSETAELACGLCTWNGDTLNKLLDRSKSTVSEDGTTRTVKIGGAGNAQGGYYAICFHHVDKEDGDVYILLKGRNTAGATLQYSVDDSTVVEPTFTALPHDDDGTLIEYIEKIPTTA